MRYRYPPQAIFLHEIKERGEGHSPANVDRDEAAIRTALLLGANFIWTGTDNSPKGFWEVEGIDLQSYTKAGVAWMYLATHGIGIDEEGRAKPLKDIGVAQVKEQR